MYKQENNLRQRNYNLIAGVDEAGRGPLAGPVVAAAIILPAQYRNPRIKDSKVLSDLEREQLFVELKNVALSYAVTIVGRREIDNLNILNAARLAMQRAVKKLNPEPDFILTDAVHLNIMNIAQKAVVKGDETVFSIAAASILAKVHRDRVMQKYHSKYPEYGFDQHKGYGTTVHLQAIKNHGPSPIHRLTFSPFSSG